MRYNLANLLELAQADEYLKKLMKQNAIVEIKKVNPRRSLQQNKYLYLLLGIAGMEWGFSIDEIKTLWKRKISPSIFVYEKNKNKFLRSTADLTTKELTDAIEQLRKFSAEQGLYLPEPHEEERLRYYANEVEKQSNYL